MKKVSLTTTFKPLILFNWLIVDFPPWLPWVYFVSGSTKEVAAVWVLGSDVGGNLPPVGVSWLGFYFFFLRFVSQCRVIESDDCKSSARAMTFKPPWGLDGSPVICADAGRAVPTDPIKKTQAACRLEALSWARGHMEQICPLFSWALIPTQKGWKSKTSLTKCSCHSVWLCCFREVTEACNPVQAAWRQAQEDLETCC